MYRRAILGLGYLPQETSIFRGMTVEQNISAVLEMAEPDASARAARLETLLDEFGLGRLRSAPAMALSGGERRRCEIARALAAYPAFVLLDEPAAGLSAEEKIQLAAVLKEIATAGIGVLVIEHDMTLVMKISDQIHVLDSGRLIASGAPSEIQRSAVVKAAYLGSGESKFLKQTASQIQPISMLDENPRAQDILVIGGVSANYGAADVLTDVSFAVRKGDTAAVLGANGAGKSTLMRVLSGLHKKFSGAVGFDGRDISHLGAHQVARLGLLMVPEGRQVFAELSVEDNIRIGAHARAGMTPEKLHTIYAMFPKLEILKARRAGLLSGGEQQMLALARGLAGEPLVLLLDEPSLGLAPAIVEDLFLRLAELKASGLTLLLVDQRADMALALADHANLLASGRMIFSGTSDALQASGKLTEAYLGA
mgnify:CR=1 FL=1